MKFFNFIAMLSALMALQLSTAGGCKTSAFHDAVLHQNVALFDNLLEKNENINGKNWNAKTPLMVAIESHKKPWFLRLMEENTNVELTDKKGWTALHCAAAFGDGEICDALLKKTMRVNVKTLHDHTPLMVATLKKNKECFDRILKVKEVDVTLASNTGRTALHLAAKYGDEKMCDALLEKGVNVNAKDAVGYTPLMTALNWENEDGNYFKVVKIFLKNNADVGVESKDGDTALKLAKEGQNHKIIKVLNSIKYIQSLFESNDTAALHVAAWFGDEKLCENLMKKGADVNVKNKRNETALIIAARENKFAVVQILLKNHADEYGESDDGTALQIAQRNGNYEVVKILERRQKTKFLIKLSKILNNKKSVLNKIKI